MLGSANREEVRDVFRLLDELECRVRALVSRGEVIDLILALRKELSETLAKQEQTTRT
jgi:hypothetical protein